jgi:hypothetical protein
MRTAEQEHRAHLAHVQRRRRERRRQERLARAAERALRNEQRTPAQRMREARQRAKAERDERQRQREARAAEAKRPRDYHAQGRKGGLAKAANLRARKAALSRFGGTILDAMDAAGMTGPSWESWRTFWKATFGLPMDKAELARFQRHTGRTTPPAAPAQEAWLIVGRRGGKSRNAALAALFLAIRRDWKATLAPGERAVIPVLAADRAQARATLGYLKGLLKLDAFAPYLARQLKDHVELRTGCDVRVSTASFRTIRGYTLAGAVCEEIAFWLNDETGANPDSEILTALRPGMATVPGALLLGLSSPYAAKGELYKAHTRYTGTDDASGLAWTADTLSMDPLVDARVIERAFAEDPVSAMSEYGCDGAVAFRRDVEGFLDAEAVRAVTVADRRELPPASATRYVAFADPSGGSADAFTLAVAHREGGRAVLDAVRERRPPFSPEDVVSEYADLLRSYGVGAVVGDRYAGEWPRERFRRAGIAYQPSARVKSDLYRELLPLVNAGRCELLDHPRLAAQLVGLERRVARGGKDSVDHAPGGHDDLANAAAGALVLAGAGASVEARRPWFPGAGRATRVERISLGFEDDDALPVPARAPQGSRTTG